MQKVIMLLTIFLGVMLTGAQEVSLTGSVTDENRVAIQGAQVSLKTHPHITGETDASGAFNLTGTATVFYHPTTPHFSQAWVRGKHIIFLTSGLRQRVTIDLFNSRGVKVSGTVLENLPASRHTVPIYENRIAQGLYFIKLTTDGKSSVLKVLLIGSDRFSGRHAFHESEMGNVLSKRAQDEIDTIVAVADGFAYTSVGIESYDQQNIEITMIALNPWMPSKPLEHNNGMVKIAASGYNFQMGQPNPDIGGGGRSDMEQPVHVVRFTYDFWMDTTEVTQGDFDNLMSSTYSDHGYFTPQWQNAYGVGENYPAYSISWDDMILYCNARSKRDGYDTVYVYDSISGIPGSLCETIGLSINFSKNGYRLPTEAEWEYACRAGTATDFYWGKDYDPYPSIAADTAEISSYTVWRANSWELGLGDPNYGTHPVASHEPNAYGLYDMSGNLYEWCNDWYGSYDSDTEIDPTGPADGQYRIPRGGGWANDAIFLRSANRTFNDAVYFYYLLGFRVVLPIQ